MSACDPPTLDRIHQNTIELKLLVEKLLKLYKNEKH